MNPDPLVQAFERRVRDSPDATLLIGPNDTWSVGRLMELAQSLSLGVAAAGIVEDEAVGLVAPNGPGFLAALLALRQNGAVAVLIDERTRAAERTRVAAELGLRHTLQCEESWPRTPDAFQPVRHGPGDAPAPRVPGAAVIKLTSGTSGQVRGVCASAAVLLADDAGLRASMGIGDRDTLLAAIPFSHSYGLSSLVVPALACGLPLIIPEPGGPLAPIDAAALGATVFPTVPAYLDALVRLAAPPALPPALRLVISAGAPLSQQTARRFRRVFALAVHVFYGASECGGIAYDRRGDAAERGTVGTPVDGVEVELDAAGRVVVRSQAVAGGYWPLSDDRLDGSRFVTDDLARWQDDELKLFGRIGAVLNIRGSKVHPAEIERVLLDLEAVEDCAVLGMSEVEGGPPSRLRAVVACRPGSLSREQVVAWCRDRLANYKVPLSVALVDRIPRNDRGKIDLDALSSLDA